MIGTQAAPSPVGSYSVLPISSIRVGDGRRAVNGYAVEQIAKSIPLIGLMNPITVSVENVLIAGLHRLRAFESLGLSEIPALVFSYSEVHAKYAEAVENADRADLSALEKAEALKAAKEFYEAMNPGSDGRGGDRKSESFKSAPGAFSKSEDDAPPFAEAESKRSKRSKRAVQTDLQIANGLTEEVKETVKDSALEDEKKQLLALASLPAEDQMAIARQVIEGEQKSVKAALEAARIKAACDAIETLEAPTGKYRVIVADPPWQYTARAKDTTHQGRNIYPTMTEAELCAMEIPAEDDAILWLWTTNAFMHEAYHIADAWGFTPKTILTWDKGSIGPGDWLRGQTEHCILCVRGKPVVQSKDKPTIIYAKRREHSRKPDEFYEFVTEMCPGKKIDIFSREKREGWDQWGAEADAF